MTDAFTTKARRRAEPWRPIVRSGAKPVAQLLTHYQGNAEARVRLGLLGAEEIDAVSPMDRVIDVMNAAPSALWSVRVIADRSGLPTEKVELVVDESADIRMSPIPTEIGLELYSVRPAVSWRERWVQWRALIAKRTY